MKLILISAALVVGVFLGGTYDLSPQNSGVFLAYFFILFGSVLLFVAAKLARGSGLFAVVIFFLFIGLIRGADADISSSWQAVPEDGTRGVFEVTNSGRSSLTTSGDYRINVNVSQVDQKGASFPAYIYADKLLDQNGERDLTSFIYGDEYLVSGSFSVADEGFSVAGFISAFEVNLVGTSEDSPLRVALAQVSGQLVENLLKVLPSDVAGIAAGITFGNRSHIDAETYTNFRSSGLAHILAISGLHVAIFGGIALLISTKLFGRRHQLYLLAPFFTVWFYVLFAGMPPSAIRAATMFSIMLLAKLLGRHFEAIPAIGLSAAIMVAISPHIIYELGFQLSFGAVLGIATITPHLFRFWDEGIGTKMPSLVSKGFSYVYKSVAITAGATVFGLPIVLGTFGFWPTLGAVSTLLVIFVLPFFVALSVLTSVLTQISVVVGEVVGWSVWLLGSYINLVASIFSGSWVPTLVSGSSIDPSQDINELLTVNNYIFPIWTLAWLLFLFRLEVLRLLVFLYKFLILGGIKAPIWASMVVVLIGFVFLFGALSNSSDELKIYFPETSIGDMAIVDTSGGNQILIDGGRDTLAATNALDNYLPFWDRKIEMVIPTHHDADHIGGLESVVERYRVDYILDPMATSDSLIAMSWRNKISDHSGLITPTAGMEFSLSGGGVLTVIWAGSPFVGHNDLNDLSTVIRLDYGEFSVLFTGDIGAEVEDFLVDSNANIEADVLKVSHHGSNGSSTTKFLRAVNPSIAIVQSGEYCEEGERGCFQNPYGHPDPETISRLVDVLGEQNRVFVNAQNGTIEIKTNGTSFSVTSDR